MFLISYTFQGNKFPRVKSSSTNSSALVTRQLVLDYRKAPPEGVPKRTYPRTNVNFQSGALYLPAN